MSSVGGAHRAPGAPLLLLLLLALVFVLELPDVAGAPGLQSSLKRAPKVMLAKAPRRPPSSSTTTSSTTTTSTTTSTTTAAPTSSELASTEEATKEQGAADSSASSSDDYEPVETVRPATRGPAASKNKQTITTAPPTSSTTPKCTTAAAEPDSTPSEAEAAAADATNETDEPAGGEASEATQAQDESAAGTSEGSPAETSVETTTVANGSARWVAPSTRRPRKGLGKMALISALIKTKDESVCINEAFLEFPRDLFGDKWRSRGLVLVHLFVVCYMFYSLALVCERYFMPSLEEFAQRLNLSEDVAGATLMSAGSSAPELFTAILGVFVAKGDVGTGAIVGSAVFNILFVIGVCAFVSSASAQLQWWPVFRDSLYYTFTVLVLILIIYDEKVTAFESFSMLLLYGVYITIMANNERLKEIATRLLCSHPLTARIVHGGAAGLGDGPDDVFGSSSSSSVPATATGARSRAHQEQLQMEPLKQANQDQLYLAALIIIMKHRRLFRSTIRFQSAARYVIVKMQQRQQQRGKSGAGSVAAGQRSIGKPTGEVDYFEAHPLRDDTERGSTSANQRAKIEAYAHGESMSKNKFSIVSRDEYELWNSPPAEGENYYIWLAKIPVNYVLHHTIPDCTLYPDKYIFTFVISIIWTAFFSYIMVWMVTLIGYTFGIPDSVMGVTFLAAGTSVPDCYSSIHAARNGMADMAVSNSIGSNVFDILIGLAVPWFIQSAIYPKMEATINSRGVIYSVILLFLSLIVTIYLLNKYEWNLQPRLGLALLIAYGLFIVLTCMLEFNLFGHVNPPACPVPADRV